MKDYFKNLNTLTQNIKRKFIEIKTQDLLQLLQKWEEIVGKKFFKKIKSLKNNQGASSKGRG